jgi:hypothetical protein
MACFEAHKTFISRLFTSDHAGPLNFNKQTIGWYMSAKKVIQLKWNDFIAYAEYVKLSGLVAWNSSLTCSFSSEKQSTSIERSANYTLTISLWQRTRT